MTRTKKQSTEAAVREIRRRTRRKFSPEEKIRIGKIPVQFWVEADYYPVHPNDLSGPRWGIDIQIIPVIPEVY
jgi:hypothetical protein